MAKRRKDEQVSISFHYLERHDGSEEKNLVKISKSEFLSIFKALEALKEENDKDDELSPETVDLLRMGKLALIRHVEEVNAHTICGIFENSYWGHSFRNSDKGDISADSLNYRPFLFLLYRSESGRIYLASQYLGNYGGYVTIQNTVERALQNKKNLSFYSFNTFSAQLDNLVPTEVIFDVAKQTKAISGKNAYGQRVAIALKDKDKTGAYQRDIKEKILSLIRRPSDKVRSELAKFLKDNDLMSIEDSELEGCKVLARINKSTVTIHILDGINRASRFPVNVSIKDNGHPEYEPLKEEALRILEEKIISSKE